MSRSHVYLLVGAVFVALGVGAMLGCGGGCTMRGPTFSVTGKTVVDGVELPHTATVRLSSPERVARLVLALESASIVVEGDATVTGIEAEFEVREKTPGDASLAAGADTVETRSASGSPVLVTKAKVRVPPGTAVDVSTAFGSVAVKGIHGAASVDARTASGGVDLADLADVPRVSGRSSFGHVHLSGGSALADVSLTTDSGGVEAKAVRGGARLALRSSFGGVEAASCDASESMSLETDSGSASVEDVKTPRAKLRSSFGGVSAKRSTFDHIDAHTSSGGVRLTGCTYKTKDLGTDFGSVKESE